MCGLWPRRLQRRMKTNERSKKVEKILWFEVFLPTGVNVQLVLCPRKCSDRKGKTSETPETEQTAFCLSVCPSVCPSLSFSLHNHPLIPFNSDNWSTRYESLKLSWFQKHVLYQVRFVSIISLNGSWNLWGSYVESRSLRWRDCFLLRLELKILVIEICYKVQMKKSFLVPCCPWGEDHCSPLFITSCSLCNKL